MSHVVVIGCGVIGAALAYELSQVRGLRVTVLDKQPPAQAATGAALGVLMGVISHKVKGKAWQMREASIQRYETLIPELEALTGRHIPFNRQGILMLLPSKGGFCTNAGEDLSKWQHLVEIRHSQGWQLEIWDAARLKSNCPQIDCERINAAIYSPQDRQVDPVALTLALVDAARRNGVTFHFGVTVDGFASLNGGVCHQIQTTSGQINVDWLVVAAGLGSSQLTAKDAIASATTTDVIASARKQSPTASSTDALASANTTDVIASAAKQSPTPSSIAHLVDIKPVLGQALHLHLGHPMGNPDFQPIITGDDVHIVPVGKGEYWVGATVEFPTDGDEVVAAPDKLEMVRQQALALCPALASATVIKTWSGLRPRPENRPAPIIDLLPGYSNILLATGHYRNGVLLAPATAQLIRNAIASL